MTPDPIQRLTAELAKLPGIGEKTAQRLAFHILRSKQDYARDLAAAIVDVVEKVRLCSVCCSLTEADPCSICADGRRDDRVICVVENVPDLLAVARTRVSRGRFLVVDGGLTPLDVFGPDQLGV